jgi:hypothetical protein
MRHLAQGPVNDARNHAPLTHGIISSNFPRKDLNQLNPREERKRNRQFPCLSETRHFLHHLKMMPILREVASTSPNHASKVAKQWNTLPPHRLLL